MTSIITGDIINSRQRDDNNEWLDALKKVLKVHGTSPRAWEIYRGDSFQVEVKNIAATLKAAIAIKAAVKKFSDLDVRMSIGIGKKTFTAKKITESNGPAFVHSGEMFEQLKINKRTLAISSPWPDINEEVNLMLRLMCIAMDKWTPSSAELVLAFITIESPSQKALMKKLKIVQSAVSERQSRSHIQEILAAEEYISQKLALLKKRR